MDEQLELNSAQKAAAILVAMGKERASGLLNHFKNHEIRKLVEAAHTLKNIPQPDLEDLVHEFETEFAAGAGLLDSADTIDSILSETLTPEELQAIHDPDSAIVIAPEKDTVWAALEDVEAKDIAEYVTAENPQAGAAILARLSQVKAAEVMSALDREPRSALLARMISMRSASPAAIRMIEARLTAVFGDGTKGAGASEAQARVAGILNELDKTVSNEMIDDMTGNIEPENIAAVKAMLFRFEDIVRLDAASRSAVFDELQADTVTLALRGADSELVEAVLSALGQRTRRMIESELQSPVPANQGDIDQSRRQITSSVLRLANDGRVVLPSADLAA